MIANTYTTSESGDCFNCEDYSYDYINRKNYLKMTMTNDHFLFVISETFKLCVHLLNGFSTEALKNPFFVIFKPFQKLSYFFLKTSYILLFHLIVLFEQGCNTYIVYSSAKALSAKGKRELQGDF